MGILDRKYSKREVGKPPGLNDPGVVRWILIGVAVLIVVSIVVSLLIPRSKPMPAEGSRLVNINTATAKDLESLPGIGPSLAQLVISGRPYANIDDLARVRGISSRQVDELRPMLTLSELTRNRQEVPFQDRIVQSAAALRPLVWIVIGIGVVAVAWFSSRWIKGTWQGYRNARTRAAFEDAERRRWEGHRRK